MNQDIVTNNSYGVINHTVVVNGVDHSQPSPYKRGKKAVASLDVG